MAYITRVQIEECRNVRGLDIDLSAPPPEQGTNGKELSGFRHLILTGPNGSGKSGVLKEVAGQVERLLFPYNENSGVARTAGLTEEPAADSTRMLGLFLDSIEWNERANPNLIDIAARGDVLAIYLPARRHIHHQKVAGPSKLHWRPVKLRPATEASAQLLQFLVNKRTEQALAAEDRDSVAAERVREWFNRFQGHLRRLMEDDALVFEFDRHAWNFQFIRKGYRFDINTLADGHAAVLAILAELLIRVDVIQETRNDFTFEPEGVVIIDEIEAHLHLSLQEQILPFLTELFPRFQFLVATHSPAVIASIPNAVVYDLKTRAAALSDDFRGIRYGTLMTEHFGISSEIDLDSTEKLIRLRELARRSDRTPEEQRAFDDLASVLSLRSRSLAVEVWMLKEGLGQEPPAAASAAQ
jgi:hypothetical protein